MLIHINVYLRYICVCVCYVSFPISKSHFVLSIDALVKYAYFYNNYWWDRPERKVIILSPMVTRFGSSSLGYLLLVHLLKLCWSLSNKRNTHWWYWLMAHWLLIHRYRRLIGRQLSNVSLFPVCVFACLCVCVSVCLCLLCVTDCLFICIANT